MRIKYPLLFISIIIFSSILFSQLTNAQGFGTELFLHMDRTSAEVGEIISGEVTVRVYKPSSSETVCIPKVIFDDGTNLILGNCLTNSDAPHDFIECDFNFIHVYDNPKTYNLRVTADSHGVTSHFNIPGPQKTITIAERATSSIDTSVQPALVATSTAEIIQSIVRVIYWIISSLLVLLIMIGGFTIITAAGDPKRVTKGKQIIVYAIIGFAIMAISRGIPELIYPILGINIP